MVYISVAESTKQQYNDNIRWIKQAGKHNMVSLLHHFSDLIRRVKKTQTSSNSSTSLILKPILNWFSTWFRDNRIKEIDSVDNGLIKTKLNQLYPFTLTRTHFV